MAGTEPLGNRILKVPEDTTRVDQRDPHADFITYVPFGSIVRGKELVMTGAGKLSLVGSATAPLFKNSATSPSFQAAHRSASAGNFISSKAETGVDRQRPL